MMFLPTHTGTVQLTWSPPLISLLSIRVAAASAPVNRETTPTHTYIPMHTPNTRLHSQRKPEMDDDNDDEDEADDDVDDDEDDEDADDEAFDDEDDDADDDDDDEDVNVAADAAAIAAVEIVNR
jgi:hypothetical protein